ncbi:MAG: site-2 protease family protein [Clostridia bacterium]|nr:site-2 protease family protein [Clostridia bacterium]
MIFPYSWTSLIFTAVAVVISMVLHELAHGYVALWNGDPTAKVNGRLTLNPLAHFDLVGFVMLIVVGFGYAKPVPVNPYNFKHPKRGLFTVAIAGVVVNLILAFISCGFVLPMWSLATKFQGNVWGSVFSGVANFFEIMALLNLNLIFFNLLPIHPLDGFRVVEAFTKFTNPYAKFIRDYGHYILIGLIGLGVVVDIFGLPAYIDILGTYISYFTGLVRKLFMAFWGLIF